MPSSLMDAMDTLLSKHGNRPLKSLSEILKRKTGAFQQNLLGKQ